MGLDIYKDFHMVFFLSLKWHTFHFFQLFSQRFLKHLGKNRSYLSNYFEKKCIIKISNRDFVCLKVSNRSESAINRLLA